MHPPSFSSLGMSKIEGDSRGLFGHPCLAPFPVGIGSDNWPFTPSPFLLHACRWVFLFFEVIQAFSTSNFDRLYQKLYKNEQTSVQVLFWNFNIYDLLGSTKPDGVQPSDVSIDVGEWYKCVVVLID